jgi:cell division protein FtsN
MNDHNLDDLIIDTPSGQGSKAKSFLTIIALFIVVLIVAIILTKIILKNPEQNSATLSETETEMISPELTLQSTSDENQEEEKALSEMIENKLGSDNSHYEVEAPEESIKQETVTIEEPKKHEPSPSVEPQTTPKTVAPKPQTAVVDKAEKKEIVKIPVVKPVPQQPIVKHQPKPAPVQAVQEKFYIQVGSFSKMPNSNSRLINTLKKQGYRYRIIKINGMHKIMVGPYKSRPDVDKAILRVKDLINKSAFVVKR